MKNSVKTSDIIAKGGMVTRGDQELWEDVICG